MQIQTLKQAGFEEVWVARDPGSKLHALIAVHDTRRGPGLGGIRMFPYRSEEEALTDVLRLAQAMTFKAAAAGLDLGGAKAVILGDPKKDKTPGLLKAMGRFVNRLEGRYLAAKDAGIVTEDLIQVATETGYVTGLPESMGGSGDPSPWTAVGILEGMRSAVAFKDGKKSMQGIHVAIQGAGHVGAELAGLLVHEKAQVTIADIDPKRLEPLVRSLNVKKADAGRIHETECDIFAPCAMGSVLNDKTIPGLKCRMVAGGANNQMEDERRHGGRLAAAGILYAPDYVLNAGGLINIYVRDIRKETDVMPYLKKIGVLLTEIFEEGKKLRKCPGEVAHLRTLKILDASGR